jgi:hypothetical protein
MHFELDFSLYFSLICNTQSQLRTPSAWCKVEPIGPQKPCYAAETQELGVDSK